MTSSLAILCPGQGTQHAAMFDMARRDPHAAAQLERWDLDAQLGMPLAKALDDPALLYSNQAAQPLIVAATLAMWTALRGELPAPALAAGYSIGELACYGVADALTAEDAIGLAVARAKLMDACAAEWPNQVMVALSGLGAAAAGELLRRYGFHVAIETGEDSFIAGGIGERLAHFEAAVVKLGARASVLPVAVASHTPYMASAVAPFLHALEERAFGAPQVPVLSGISGSLIKHPEQARQALARQLAETIRWADCMDACVEAGITVALELGPGSSLSRMLQARHATIECRSVADFRSLEGVRKWLASRIG